MFTILCLALALPVVPLPGKSHGRRSLAGCSLWGRKESDMTERLPFHFSLSCTGEGNGNPFQCSCLENPRDGGAWWAAVSGVAQSRTRLTRLSSSSSSNASHIVGGEIVGESGDVREGMCQKSCCSVASRERLEPFSLLREGLRLSMLTPPHWHKSQREGSFLWLILYHVGAPLSSPVLLRGCHCPTHPALKKTHSGLP